MSNRKIVIPVEPERYGYSEYCELIRPYLDVFGMPYDELSPKELPACLSDGAALILLAQPGLTLSDDAAVAVMSALGNGTGIVCTDGTILYNTAFDGIRTIHDMPSPSSGSSIEITQKHYATRFHDEGESIPLYSAASFYVNTNLRGGQTLAKMGGFPLLEVSEHCGGKVVLWNNVLWIRTSVLGPVHGMDDIMRDSIVWAAKKPFAMKSLPPFVGMRVDDVWGAWRDKAPENPLSWIEISNKYGFKPWLGIFQDNINEKSTELVRGYVESGIATAFPHAFAGCEWVASDIPEHWAYFDHRNGRPWSDEVMELNAARAKEWFDKNKIPISKLALAHYYETGENALKHFLRWGCEFIGIHMPPDAPYRSQAELKCGPYRKYTALPCSASRPVYFADYLEFPYNPEIDKKLFNCVTEIRDVRGYELAPSNDVEKTIDSGVRQLRRAILSSVPAVLFTHESCWIQRITVENWEAEMSGIYDGIADLNPVFDTMDNICKYVRASHDITISVSDITDGKLKISFTGNNNSETKCAVFTETDGDISQSMYDVPRVNGKVTLTI
ncbi:MAG: hypothetical protein IJ299_00755 [Oscillospiraceae bacterium]|nr:hypothetical protein [Oscillospiraceae bacterium]